MRFALSAEQDQFRQATRDFLTTYSSPARVREVIDTDDVVDEKLWRRLANDLGVVGLNIPEEFGGTGATFVEVAIAAEELGRALACVPFLSTAVLATSALLESGDPVACRDILPAIAEGRSILTVALGDGPARTDRPADPVPAAESVDGQWRVNGELTFVLDGAVADAVLFAADTDGGPSLFLVDSSAAQVESLTGLDLTRRFAHLRFAAAPARLVGTVGDATRILTRVADLGSVAIAADAVGGAESCLDMAVAYAKIREQFGKPIGSFQAVKHKCATVLLEVESARAAAYFAAWAAMASPEDLPQAASMSKAYCSDMYVHAAQENIQIHGGIGFSWEHPAHLYFRRAKSAQLLFGSPSAHRERLADLLGI